MTNENSPSAFSNNHKYGIWFLKYHFCGWVKRRMVPNLWKVTRPVINHFLFKERSFLVPRGLNSGIGHLSNKSTQLKVCHTQWIGKQSFGRFGMKTTTLKCPRSNFVEITSLTMNMYYIDDWWKVSIPPVCKLIYVSVHSVRLDFNPHPILTNTCMVERWPNCNPTVNSYWFTITQLLYPCIEWYPFWCSICNRNLYHVARDISCDVTNPTQWE